MNLTPIIIFFNIIVNIKGNNVTEGDIDDTVQTITDNLLIILGINEDVKETDKIKELKEKLKRIDVYAKDKTKYTQMLVSEVKNSDLNKTNFYEALNDRDHFQFMDNGTGSLFLKLKEKMNRDDVMRVLADRGSRKMMRYARRMMDDGTPDRYVYSRRMEDIFDKMIGETARDDHKYTDEERESKYWDPDPELQDLNEFHRHDGRRLFRGERTTIRYYPFMVSIHVMGRFWCGGVLYWHDIVITSASCLQLMHNNRYFRENPRVLMVRVGSNHSRIGGEMIDAVEVYFHPSYNPRTLKNNIAVIRLRRLISFKKKIPKLIDISHNADGLTYTSEVLLLGWGVTKTSQKMAYEPIFLQRKILPIYPNKFCKEVYGDRFITSTMFCAGTLTTGEGACDHDAGGPAIMAGKLVGIISFGPTVCGYPNVPTVFSLVGNFADWIETVNQSMPDYYRGKQPSTTTSPRTTFGKFSTLTPVSKKNNTTGGLQKLPPYNTIEKGGVTGIINNMVTVITIAGNTPSVATISPPPGFRAKRKGISKRKKKTGPGMAF